MQPDRIGPYRLVHRLGAGGMGSVYFALDPAGHPVAVKVIHQHVAERSEDMRRVAREVAAIKRIHSPYVAEFVDTQLQLPDPYIVTQYVEGRTLQQQVEAQGPLTPPEVRKLSIGLAAALDAIHEAGVVHRDLTPRNIMISRQVPIVIDFGICQMVDTTRITHYFVGTPGYAAPELIQGRRGDQATDVFAWAATLVFAATGRKCFAGDTVLSTLHRTLHSSPDLSGVPGDLQPVVARALRKNPAERPSSQSLVGVISAFSPQAVPPLPLHRTPHQNPLSALWIAAGEAREEGDLDRASELYESVLLVADGTGDLGSQMFVLYQLGGTAEALGHFDRAVAYYHRALEIAVINGSPNIELLTLRGLERIAAERGQQGIAHAWAERARHVLEAKQGHSDPDQLIESADRYLRRMRRQATGDQPDSG